MFVCRMRVAIASAEECPVVYCVPQCAVCTFILAVFTGEVRSVDEVWDTATTTTICTFL